jgi:hypothetical protein
LTLLAEPSRFHLAMEIGFVLSLVFATRSALQRWPALRKPTAIAFTTFCAFQLVVYCAYARRVIRSIDVTKTSEYKSARWLDAHMRGSRVLVPGSTTFWLNAFTDTPQLTGCCSQSVINHIIPYANYGIITDIAAENRAFENSLLWLKALGVRAVAVSGPHSTEIYKPFRNPHKFDGRFHVLWRDGDDAIYEIPWQYYSLAHAIKPTELVQRAPIHGADTAPLVPYVAAIDAPDASPLDMRWSDNESIVISGKLRRNQVVTVQICAHFGWHAVVDGSERRVFRDEFE